MLMKTEILRGRRYNIYPDRPKKCPFCGYRIVWSNADRWKCGKCYKSWGKKTFPRRKDLGDRPKCLCGASNPISEGVNWLCTECGRHWLKIYRIEKQLTQREVLSAQVFEI